MKENLIHILNTLRALEYPLEQVVSTVSVGGSAEVICSAETLQQAIVDITRQEVINKKLILLNLNSANREFIEGYNSHHAALYLTQDGTGVSITYIDPTGAEISQQITDIIKSTVLANCTIKSSKVSLQPSISGKDLDSALLLALAADMIRRNYHDIDQIKLDESALSKLRHLLQQIANKEKTILEVGGDIGKILHESNLAASKDSLIQTYNNTPIELIVLERLRKEFDTTEKQLAQVTKLINEFGNKHLVDKKITKPHPTKPGRTITETIPGAKYEVLDIMCLAQLLFEVGDKKIVNKLRSHILLMDDVTYPDTLEYLEKCLASFKPAIYNNLKAYFAEKYGVLEEQVECTPKPTGKQVGAKVIVHDPKDPGNPKVFYAKSHQEFCSRSDAHLGTVTSNGIGFVDLKELFMYKVLERLGYGPKTEFVMDKSVPKTRVEEGVMIVTQDSGYTKTPSAKDKSFKTFGQISSSFDEASIAEIDETTRKDLVIIDMISRIFCLGDVMVNEGNFGRVEVKARASGDEKLKWKVVDFLPPKVYDPIESKSESRYNYSRYYKGSGINIAQSFINRNGNPSHTYDSESAISKILSNKETEKKWNEVIDILTHGKSTGKKIGIEEAVHQSFEEIKEFLNQNKETLKLTEENGGYKAQTTRRLNDLEVYYNCVLKNFKDLTTGIKTRGVRVTEV